MTRRQHRNIKRILDAVETVGLEIEDPLCITCDHPISRHKADFKKKLFLCLVVTGAGPCNCRFKVAFDTL